MNQDLLASRHLEVSGSRLSYGGFNLNSWHLTLSNPRFCPRCLEEDLHSEPGRWEARPHVRFEWFMSFTDVCARHGARIFTSRHSYEISNRFDFAVYLRTHRAEVETEISNCEREAVHPYDQYFANRLAGIDKGVEFLDDLSYPMAQRLCLIVGRTTRLRDDPKLRSERRINADRDVRVAGFKLLDDRSKMLSCLSGLNEAFLRRNKFSKGYALYGELQNFLSANIAMPELRPFIDLVRECAMSELPIGPEDPFIGGGGTRRWHTLHTAMRDTGVDSRTLRKILEERGTIDVGDRKKSDNRIVLRADDIDAVAAEYRTGLDIENMTKTLGLVLPTVQKMIKRGLLEPMFANAGGGKPRFSRSAVDKLVESVVAGVEESDELPHLSSLGKASHRAVCAVVDIVEAIMKGELSTRFLSRDRSRVGFDRLLVDVNELKALFRPPAAGLKCHEFARALGLGYATGKSLFHSGLLELKKVEGGANGVVHFVVENEQYNAFRRDFASLAELAVDWMPYRELREALTDNGVAPVWAVRERRIATFYRRSDVDAYRRKFS